MSNVAKTETWPVSKLHRYENNARKHPTWQIDLICNSIKEFGFINPIIVKEDGEIVAGHGRLAACEKLGIDKVPVLIVDYLSQDQVNAYRIADNQIGLMGSWDEELLKVEIASLVDAEFDVNLLGFKAQDLEALIGALDEFDPENDNEPDEAEEEENNDTLGDGDNPFTGETLSQEGEIYWLGPHRLYCGSSLDPQSWDRLMGGEKADLCFTDPPYGIAYNGGGGWSNGAPDGDNREMRSNIDNDELIGPELYSFLMKALGNMKDKLKEGGAMYVCSADSLLGFPFVQAVKDLGLWRERGGELIWVKQRSQFGRTDYQYQHERILYGWKEGGSHWFTPDRSKTTTLFFKRPTKSDAHPTMKPVDLVQELIMNSSKRGEVIIDGFGGSGTTLIACATVGRSARLIELQPYYCDVIRRRWGAFAQRYGFEIGDGIVDGKKSGAESFDQAVSLTSSDAEAQEQASSSETLEKLSTKYE